MRTDLAEVLRLRRPNSCEPLELLLCQKRNAEIEARNFKFRIGCKGPFEILLCVRGPLLIHVRNAESVEAIRFGGIGLKCTFSLCHGRGLPTARKSKYSGNKKKAQTTEKNAAGAPQGILRAGICPIRGRAVHPCLP